MHHTNTPTPSWFQIARPFNLLMVVICCVAVRFLWWLEYNSDWLPSIGLILSAVLITAGGNILNDYYDVRVDKLNRPNRPFIGSAIRRKKAIPIHATLTLLACMIGMVMSFYHGFRVAIIPLLTGTCLWWYSPVLKKKFLIGNLVVACCVGILPMWGTIDLWKDSSFSEHALPALSTLSLTLCGFLLTLAREIVKDLEDRPGDEQAGYTTLAITWPLKRTKGFIYVTLLMTWACIIAFSIHMRLNNLVVGIAAILCGIPLIISVKILRKAKEPLAFGKVSRWLKWSSLAGIVFMVINALIEQFAATLP
jgi:4-hydroxybenzoate polyprenyltransferase